MPIYEYRCGTCGFQKEYLQRLSEPALTDCPECGKATFNKMVTAAGFQLKGTGWYVTDFRDKGNKGKQAGSASNGKDKTADGGSREAKDTSSKDTSGGDSSSGSTSTKSDTGSTAAPAA